MDIFLESQSNSPLTSNGLSCRGCTCCELLSVFELSAINAKPMERFSSTPMKHMPTNKMKDKEPMTQGNKRNNTLLKKNG